MSVLHDEQNWEITPDGLFVATRRFLVRRGYCCGNRCRNCPYINWQNSRSWQPTELNAIRRHRVAPRVITGLETMIHQHREALSTSSGDEYDYHQRMLEHHQGLLAIWQ